MIESGIISYMAQRTASQENIRPWGRYDIVDAGDGYQVKRITVESGKRCSYQSHKKRSEHWVLVSGIAAVTLNDARMQKSKGDILTVPVGSKHRIENIGTKPVIFIEVQMGEYFGEDDTERYHDDFGRELGDLSKK